MDTLYTSSVRRTHIIYVFFFFFRSIITQLDVAGDKAVADTLK